MSISVPWLLPARNLEIQTHASFSSLAAKTAIPLCCIINHYKYETSHPLFFSHLKQASNLGNLAICSWQEDKGKKTAVFVCSNGVRSSCGQFSQRATAAAERTQGQCSKKPWASGEHQGEAAAADWVQNPLGFQEDLPNSFWEEMMYKKKGHNWEVFSSFFLCYFYAMVTIERIAIVNRAWMCMLYNVLL